MFRGPRHGLQRAQLLVQEKLERADELKNAGGLSTAAVAHVACQPHLTPRVTSDVEKECTWGDGPPRLSSQTRPQSSACLGSLRTKLRAFSSFETDEFHVARVLRALLCNACAGAESGTTDDHEGNASEGQPTRQWS